MQSGAMDGARFLSSTKSSGGECGASLTLSPAVWLGDGLMMAWIRGNGVALFLYRQVLFLQGARASRPLRLLLLSWL